MQPVSYNINEVVIKPKKVVKIGTDTKSKRITAYFYTKNALGGELASKIKVKNTPCQLNYLSFNIARNDFDSIVLRLNIYSILNNLPNKNQLTNNIIIPVSQMEGVITVDLKEHSIIIEDDIIVSLEILELFGKEDGYCSISSSLGGVIFFRRASHDVWLEKTILNSV